MDRRYRAVPESRRFWEEVQPIEFVDVASLLSSKGLYASTAVNRDSEAARTSGIQDW